jgi:hypothetical protein
MYASMHLHFGETNIEKAFIDEARWRGRVVSAYASGTEDP